MSFKTVTARNTLAEVRPSDLEWYFNLHDQLNWTYAKTMPFAPHSYVWYGRNISKENYDRAFGVIKTFGDTGKYWDRTQIYLHNHERGHRYWLMDIHYYTCYIINMAEDGKDYGAQDAPSTFVEGWSEYDAIGAWWDDIYREFDEFDQTMLWKLVHQNAQLGRPKTLDLGAGTGGTIDADVAPSEFTTAVDSSQAMLNDLVVKYPSIGRVFPGTVSQFLEQHPPTELYDLVIASMGSASYLHPSDIAQAAKLSEGLTVFGFYKTTPTHRHELPETHEAALAAAMRLPGFTSMDIGNYTYVIGRGM